MLYASGSNACGQLGDGTQDDQHTWVGTDLPSVKAIAAGGNHTLFLTAHNTLLGVGSSSRGQLTGYHDVPALQTLPLRMPNNATLVPRSIAAAWETTFVHFEEGSTDVVCACGSNDFGLLGRATPLPDSDQLSPVLLDMETPFEMAQLVSGPRHALALVKDRQTGASSVYGWGATRKGQLSAPLKELPRARCDRPTKLALLPGTSNIQGIAAGMHFSAILYATGTGLSCALLGPQPQTITLDPIERPFFGATWSHLFLSAPSRLTKISPSGTVQEVPLPPGLSIARVAAGSEHLLVCGRAAESYETLGLGWNEHGNLGLGHTTNVDQLTRIQPPSDECPQTYAGNGTSWIQRPT